MLVALAAKLAYGGYGPDATADTRFLFWSGAGFNVIAAGAFGAIRPSTRVWWASFALFTALAVYSLILALVGSTSCGCAGRIQIPPVATFLLNSVVAAVFGLTADGSEARPVIAASMT